MAIDAVGFRYAKTWLHAIQRALKLERDSPDILNECIMCVRKAGNVSIIGDYIGVRVCVCLCECADVSAGVFVVGHRVRVGGRVHASTYAWACACACVCARALVRVRVSRMCALKLTGGGGGGSGTRIIYTNPQSSMPARSPHRRRTSSRSEPSWRRA